MNQKRLSYVAGGIAVIAMAIFALTQLGYIHFADGSYIPRFGKQAFDPNGPRLERSVTLPPEWGDELKQTWNDSVAQLRQRLTENNADVGAWFDLAIRYKQAGDYAGALEIWEFVDVRYIDGGVSKHNIAEHYFHQAKDYERAEMLYREAIEETPSLAVNYTDLHEMYRYVYKTDTSAAVDIIIEGLGNVEPRSTIDLNMVLAAYYLEKGDVENARKYYTAARDTARSLNLATLLTQLNGILRDLR